MAIYCSVALDKFPGSKMGVKMAPWSEGCYEELMKEHSTQYPALVNAVQYVLFIGFGRLMPLAFHLSPCCLQCPVECPGHGKVLAGFTRTGLSRLLESEGHTGWALTPVGAYRHVWSEIWMEVPVDSPLKVVWRGQIGHSSRM